MSKKDLLGLIKDITENDKEVKITPRDLMNFFGVERRTKGNQVKINKFLEDHHLETEPDYTTAWVDSEIVLKHKEKAKSKKELDPTHRIKILDAANKKPIVIARDSSLKEAVTLMMIHNFSQLPVLSSPKSVIGVVTWESIGRAMTNGLHSDELGPYISNKVTILDYETALLEAIPIVIENEFVLVQKQDKNISGIVTIADISSQFLILTEPFLLLEQIESNIRRLLDGKYLLEQLRLFCKKFDKEREINHIDDLNFGDYIRLLENPEYWEKAKLPFDRLQFTRELDKVREIRNDIMHFDPEGITKEQRQVLLNMAKFLTGIKG